MNTTDTGLYLVDCIYVRASSVAWASSRCIAEDVATLKSYGADFASFAEEMSEDGAPEDYAQAVFNYVDRL